jgi:hypothetical protein
MGRGGEFLGIDVQIPFSGADDAPIAVTFETPVLSNNIRWKNSSGCHCQQDGENRDNNNS